MMRFSLNSLTLVSVLLFSGVLCCSAEKGEGVTWWNEPSDAQVKAEMEKFWNDFQLDMEKGIYVEIQKANSDHANQRDAIFTPALDWTDRRIDPTINSITDAQANKIWEKSDDRQYAFIYHSKIKFPLAVKLTNKIFERKVDFNQEWALVGTTRLKNYSVKWTSTQIITEASNEHCVIHNANNWGVGHNVTATVTVSLDFTWTLIRKAGYWGAKDKSGNPIFTPEHKLNYSYLFGYDHIEVNDKRYFDVTKAMLHKVVSKTWDEGKKRPETLKNERPIPTSRSNAMIGTWAALSKGHGLAGVAHSGAIWNQYQSIASSAGLEVEFWKADELPQYTYYTKNLLKSFNGSGVEGNWEMTGFHRRTINQDGSMVVPLKVIANIINNLVAAFTKVDLEKTITAVLDAVIGLDWNPKPENKAVGYTSLTAYHWLMFTGQLANKTTILGAIGAPANASNYGYKKSEITIQSLRTSGRGISKSLFPSADMMFCLTVNYNPHDPQNPDSGGNDSQWWEGAGLSTAKFSAIFSVDVVLHEVAFGEYFYSKPDLAVTATTEGAYEGMKFRWSQPRGKGAEETN